MISCDLSRGKLDVIGNKNTSMAVNDTCPSSGLSLRAVVPVLAGGGGVWRDLGKLKYRDPGDVNLL